MTSLVLSRFRPDDVRGGAALRNAQNIRVLSRFGPVDVASIGVNTPRTRISGIRSWAPFPPSAASGSMAMPGRWLLHRREFPGATGVHSVSVMQWIRQRVAGSRYDVVVIEGLVLATFMAPLRRLGLPLVFDAHNVETALCHADLEASSPGAGGLRRIKNIAVRRRVNALERYAVRTADLVWTCSATDAADLRRRFRPSVPVVEVVNGVDIAAYGRPPDGYPSGTAEDWTRLPVTMVYPGLFSYGPNEDAALRLVDAVLPAIRARGYRARVVLAGRGPTPALLERARRDRDVTVTGELDSIVPVLQQPCVVTLPIAIGSGTRLKIAEAFAAGSPVVTTAKGAEGLQVLDEEHLLIREDPDSIAAAVIDLWCQPERRRRLCARAYEVVCERYSWSAAAAAIGASLALLPRSGAASRTPVEVRA